MFLTTPVLSIVSIFKCLIVYNYKSSSFIKQTNKNS